MPPRLNLLSPAPPLPAAPAGPSPGPGATLSVVFPPPLPARRSMYTTCLHCQHDLGTNQSVETFPVSRKVAFDAAQGRLWAICPHCQRWNLAPLDERWEAIEQCERLFRGTRIRTSTDQIGLARLKDGTELVRIGEPLRPEF